MNKKIFLAIPLIYAILILERILLKYSIAPFYLLLLSMAYSLPIITLFFVINKNSDTNIKFSKRIIKYFVYLASTCLISVILLFLIMWKKLNPYGEETLFFIIGPVFYFFIFLIIYPIISAIMLIITRAKNKIYPKTCFAIILAVIFISAILTVNYSYKCGITGCRNEEKLAKSAYDKNNPDICKYSYNNMEISSGDPILGISNSEFGDEIDCYKELAKLSKNLTVCENINSDNLISAEECFRNTADSNAPKKCEIIANQNLKSACYYAYATYLKDKNLCKNIIDLNNINFSWQEQCEKEIEIKLQP